MNPLEAITKRYDVSNALVEGVFHGVTPHASSQNHALTMTREVVRAIVLYQNKRKDQ